ncbi:MAG: murein biosynthesis integral membrane protein MurJ [Gammaproteobacteria bacterium]|nr:murein biosynthesis integral membrane protein MurJ [Gammaproteobacteria bacterium]
MAKLSASLILVGGTTLLSRLLGFGRDLLIARLFGASAGTDAFFVAFKIPNLFRRLFGEGAFAAALVPVLHQAEHQGGQAELRRLLGSLSGVLGAGVVVATLMGLLAAPVLILVFAPGFAAQPDQQDLAAELVRLTLPYLAFIVLAALAGAVLNLKERFGVPAFTPVLLNLAIIGCALWLAPRLSEPILALGWGVLLGGLAQLTWQVPFIARLGLLTRPRWERRHPGTRQVLRRLAPVLFGVSVTQINLLLDTFLASFLTTGSISWLYYSDRLVEFPLGILGAALGTVILPRLARLGRGSPWQAADRAATGTRAETDAGSDASAGARTNASTCGGDAALADSDVRAGAEVSAGPGFDASEPVAAAGERRSWGGDPAAAHPRDREGHLVAPSGLASASPFSHTLDWALRWVLLLGLPASLGLALLAEPLVATLFLSSEFGPADVRMTALSLAAYAAGLTAFMAVKVLAPGYYARQDVRSPARIGLIALGVNLGLSLVLMAPWGHAGLALATSLAGLVNAGLLLGGLWRAGIYQPGRDWPRLLVQGAVASGILAALLSWGPENVTPWLVAPVSTRLGGLMAWILAGALVYLVALLVLGVRWRHLVAPGDSVADAGGPR